MYILIISRTVLLRVRYVLAKTCRPNQDTHIVFKGFFSKIVPYVR